MGTSARERAINFLREKNGINTSTAPRRTEAVPRTLPAPGTTDYYAMTGQQNVMLNALDAAAASAKASANIPDASERDIVPVDVKSGWDYVGQQQAERARTSRGANIFRSWFNRRASSDIDAAATVSEAVAPGNEQIRAARNEVAKNAGGGFWGNFLADLVGMPSSGNQFADQATIAMRSLDDSYVPALQEKADELNERAVKADQAAKEGLGWLGTQAVNAATSGLDMLADKAETLLLPGIGLTAMGYRTFGGSAGEARREGADIRQQMIYGIANAAVEVGSEMLGDISNIYGVGLTDEFVEAVIKKIGANPLLSFLIRGSAAAVGESLEEAVAGALEPGLKAIYDNQSVFSHYGKDTWKEIGESMFVGGVLGALGYDVQAGARTAQDAAQNAPTKRANSAIDAAYAAMESNGMFSQTAREAAEKASKATQRVRDTRTWKAETPTAAQYNAGRILGEGTFFSGLGGEAVRAVVDEGLESEPGTESRRLAEEYVKRLDNGGNLTPEEIGRLHMANQDAIREEAWENKQTLREYTTEPLSQTVGKAASQANSIRQVALSTMGEHGVNAAALYRGHAFDTDPAEYYNEARQVYEQGRTGAEMKDDGSILSEKEQKAWYDAGRADAQEGVQNEEQSGNEGQRRIDSLDTAGQGQRLAEGAAEPGTQDGGRRSTGTQNLGVAQEEIKAQKAAAEKLAEGQPMVSSAERGISTGTNFKTFRIIPDSTRANWTEKMNRVTEKAEKDGVKVNWYTGRMFIEEGGRPVAVRGLNVGNGSVIWIRADADEDIEKIGDHELFHTAEKRNPALKEEIRKRITEDKQDAQLLDMIRYYQDKYKGAGLSDDEILSEIFADAYANIDVFAAVSSQKVRAPQFNRQVSETKAASSPTGAKIENATTMASREGEIPSAVEKLLDKYGATVRDGVVVADSVARIMDSPEYRQPVSVSDLASHDTLPAWAEKYINGGGSQEALQAIQRFDDMIWKSITGDFTDAQKLMQALVPSGKVAADKYGPLRTNVEYRRSFDMDTSCPRTFQFVAYRNAIMKRLNRTLTFNESINLLNLMSAYHQMIPCTYCYVENKRILKAGYYNNFYSFHNAVLNGIKDGLAVEDLRPLMYGWDAKKGKLTSAAEKTLTDKWMKDTSGYNPTIAENYHTVNLIRNAAMHLLDGMRESGKITADTSVNSLTNIIANEYGIKSKGALAEVRKMAEDWRYDAGRNAEHVYLVEDLGEEFDRKIADRALELDNEAISYANSASSAKTVDNYAPYGGELENISEADRKYILGMGGIRKHSSNDFRMDYVLDYFQFFADLAKGKWTGHTYTKNGDYVRIFGLTGDMINMSIAFNDTADGVTENVSEGMEHKMAKELREAYRNAGVMAMVTSDKQLSYALNADWVDMIIPFHNSGLPKEIWYNMKAWADYTSVQSESLYNGDEMKAALKSRGIDTKGMSAAQVQDSFYETFGLKKAVDTETGKQFAPHFFPYETVQHGVTVPGHGNSKTRYMELCREYGVHPRFDGVIVQDANGKDINVVDHPNYMKLVKETAAADENFVQPTIEFSFNKADPYLTEKYGKEYGKKSVTPMDYAMARLNEEAKNGGYQNAADDQFGIVDEFIRDYAGKGRPLGWLSDRAEMTKEALDTAQDKLVEANREAMREEFKKTEGKKEKPKVRSNFYAEQNTTATVNKNQFSFDEGTGVKNIENLTEEDELDLLYKAMYEYAGRSYIPLRRNTPHIFIDEVARYTDGKTVVNDVPIIAEVQHLRDTMEDDVENYNDNYHPHAILPEEMISIIKGMDDPSFIVLQDNGRYVEVIRYRGAKRGRVSWATLDLGKNQNPIQMNGYPGGAYNVLVTPFEPDDLDEYMKNHVTAVLYDKEKDAASRGSNRQWSSHTYAAPFADDTVSQQEPTVNSDMISRDVTDMASRDVTDEVPDRNYNIPEGYGVFIRNTASKYVDKIFSGEKTVETRPSRTLDSYLHKWAPIIDTTKRQVIGEAYIDSVIEYDDPDDFRKDADRHLVPERSKYDWDGTGKRYGYVITETRKYDTPIPVPEDAKKYGRIASAYSREDDTDRLRQENIDLRQRLDEALADTRQTRAWRANTKDVTRVAADIIDATSSKESKAIVEQKIRSLVEAASNGGIDSAEMKDLALDIARGLLRRSSVLTSPDSTTYYAMRDYLKSVYINVPVEMRKQFADWKAFAAAHKAMRMKTAGVEINTVYSELQKRMGEDYFPPMTGEMDKLLQIAEILDNLTPVYDNPYSVNMAEATEETANGILEAILDIGQAEPTFADRAKARESEVRSLYQQKLAEQKEYLQQRIRQEADKRQEQAEAIRQHYAEMREIQRTRKNESADRQKLLRVAKRLQNRKMTAVNRAIIDQLIGDLDTVSVHLTNKSLTNLRELADWYESFKDDPNFISDPQIEKKLSRLEKRQIGNMTIDEVRDLTDVLRSIENALAQYGKMIRTEDRRLVSEMSEQSQENIRNTNGSKKGITNWLVTNTLAPERLVRRLTGYNDNDPLYMRTKELSEGQRKMFDYQMRAEALFSRWTNDKKFIESLRNKDTIKVRAFVDGKETTVEITPDMRMALYLHSLNDQNLKHIANGGVTIPDIELYRKGDIAEAYSRGVTAKLSPEMVRGIASGMTAEEKAFAKAAHDYFNGMSKDEINAVSEALLGYSLAQVDDYFPIQTDDAFTQKEIDAIQNDGTIQGMGFTKERVNASNAIFLVPMTDVLKRSIQNHAKYVGMAIPVANMNKLWMANTKDGETDTTSGLKSVMRSQWGAAAKEAIDNILTDVQNPRRSKDGKWLASIRSNYAAAVLSLNASVALKQAASYPTAAAVLGWEPLVKAMGNLGRVDLDLINKYTPLQWYRSKGYSTQEIGDIRSKGGIMDKVLNATIKVNGRDIPILNWIQGIDLATTRKLWKASEYYVQANQKNLHVGSDEYYQAVADIYNRVIEETQPNYTAMQRPQILRTDNQLLQTMVMFKTQPFQNFNILYDAIGELRAAERMAKNGDDSKLAQAKKNAFNAITSNLVSAVVFAAMTMAWALARRKKDKYEDEAGNFSPWKQLGKDVLSSEFGMIPFGSDAYELLASWVFGDKYYGMSNVTADSISGALDATKSAFDTLSSAVSALLDGDEATNADPETIARKLYASAKDLSKLAGIPLENVVNLITAVYTNVASAVDGEYVTAYYVLRLNKDLSSSANKSAAYDILYKAYQQNKAQYNELRSMMIDDGFKSENIDKAMKKRVSDNGGIWIETSKK